MRTSRAGKAASRQQGFTYAAVLVAVVIVGIGAEVAYLSMVRIVQAEKEAELLFRGQAYLRAIESFHKTNGVFPRSLDELLKDPRSASKHHIRVLYPDPMAKEKKQGWQLIPSTDGGVGGVASRSSDKPIKTANFPEMFDKFSGTQSYSEWIFDYVAPVPAIVPKAGTAPSQEVNGRSS